MGCEGAFRTGPFETSFNVPLDEPIPALMKNRTTVERKSERELVVTRTFDAPARIVFEAWTRPELLRRWWAPCSSANTSK
jgi:hypothetical protein